MSDFFPCCLLLPVACRTCFSRAACCMKSHFGSCIGESIKRRLTKPFAPYDLDFDSVINLDACLSSLKRCRKADVIKIIKTWVDGWVTFGRFHEDPCHPCLLGCAGHCDDLAHCLVCPHLLALSKFPLIATHKDPVV